MPIKHYSFSHGGFYHYRFHKQKTEQLISDFQTMKDYLHNICECCPDELFLKGPRSSKAKLQLKNLNIEHHKNHEVSVLAKNGLITNEQRYKTNHSKVQVFMLEHDQKTLAVEIPLWLQPHEYHNYAQIFESQDPLTGHIDILRLENDKIGVWDYKPGAKKEKYATTQTYLYALMLSQRTNLPLSKFICGYFDKNDTYTFEPSTIKI